MSRQFTEKEAITNLQTYLSTPVPPLSARLTFHCSLSLPNWRSHPVLPSSLLQGTCRNAHTTGGSGTIPPISVALLARELLARQPSFARVFSGIDTRQGGGAE